MLTKARAMILACSLLPLFGPPESAIGADIKTLGNVLSPAYLAMNFAVVCARQDPAFLSTTGGARGTAILYAQHVKDELVGDLEVGAAEIVVREAANVARSLALGFLRSMAGGSDLIEAERVRTWCETTAKPFVRGVVTEHDNRHDLFEQVLEAAKRS